MHGVTPPLSGSLSVRGRYLAFIARHEMAWELAFGVLAVAYVVIGFAADDASLSIRPTLAAIEAAITVVFVAEFASRFLASYDRRAYLRGHWIDLVALIPGARWLRLLRLVRLFAGVHRALGNVERLAQHRGLGLLITAWLGVMVICSAALFIAEREVNKAINDPLDAIWWGIVTLTTVGYGDVYPVTPEGRLAASVLMLLGIGLFGAITATITSYLVATQRGSGDSPSVRLRELAALRDEGVITADDFDAKKADLLGRM
jgi:voltage-gated potassium channel